MYRHCRNTNFVAGRHFCGVNFLAGIHVGNSIQYGCRPACVYVFHNIDLFCKHLLSLRITQLYTLPKSSAPADSFIKGGRPEKGPSKRKRFHAWWQRPPMWWKKPLIKRKRPPTWWNRIFSEQNERLLLPLLCGCPCTKCRIRVCCH